MSHPHGCVSWNWGILSGNTQMLPVTPSRVCELKCWPLGWNRWTSKRHTLTGVWVEMFDKSINSSLEFTVTPSRVCELKFTLSNLVGDLSKSHPHGCVSWNFDIIGYSKCRRCHTLTGVWVEIAVIHYTPFLRQVTPSRVCELKFRWRCRQAF